MNAILVQLSENDKRLIFALLLILILVFVLIGFIGMWISKVMKWQGKRMDTLVHDAVVTKVITDKKHLIRYGRKKNWRQFYKQAWVPLIIVMASFLVLLITCLIRNDFHYDIFDYETTGIGTILFVWDFNDPNIYVNWFGIRIIADWPPLVHSPTFKIEALGSYIFVPTFLVGVIWYLIAIQCLIARSYRLFKLSHSIFEKSLEGYNQNDFTNIPLSAFPNPTNPNLGAVQQPQNNQVNNQQDPTSAQPNERPPLGGGQSDSNP